MTTARLNGIRLSYDDHGGDGPPVVLVMGTGSPGRVWQTYQVPALRASGLHVVTLDNRGVPPSDECADGFTVADMAADVLALVEHLGSGPAALVGTSLGAVVVVEAALARPDLISRVVAIGAHARLGPVQHASSRGEMALFDAGIELPDEHRAAVAALQYLSPATLREDRVAEDWLDVLTFGQTAMTGGHRAQLEAGLALGDRRDAYRAFAAPLLVVAFADDATIPPWLSREVADAVPGARYLEIPDAGHYGYLERPGEVNRTLCEWLSPS